MSATWGHGLIGRRPLSAQSGWRLSQAVVISSEPPTVNRYPTRGASADRRVTAGHHRPREAGTAARRRLFKRAGLRRITLHDSRHTTLTLMEHAGVPLSIISKWAGHYDAAFTQRTYVHASSPDLEQGRRALARIHKIAQLL